MPLEQLSAYVDFEVEKMRVANTAITQKRASSLHRIGGAVQDFTLTFRDFLKAYSGIVEVVQAADAQYGNVAFAALSLLFVVYFWNDYGVRLELGLHKCRP